MYNLRLNFEINPTFKEREVVFLVKDCDYYSEIAGEDHPVNHLFKQNCFFVVLKCGMSKFYLDKNGAITTPIDNTEFCVVEIISEDREESLDPYQGVIKAEDLKRYGSEFL